ncbi:MAG: cupredoxin domain-containing protein [Acidimicrobiia bacterium]
MAVTAAGLLVLGACGSGDGDSASTTTAGEHMEEEGEGHTEGDGGHAENSAVAPGARTIEVSATSFEYGTPTIEATVGEDIEIVLTSDDVEHDFIIDEFEAHVSAEPGETASGGFTASEAGEYTFYCSVPGHRDEGMEGTLVVTEAS